MKFDLKLFGSLVVTLSLLLITGYTLQAFPPANWLVSVVIMILTGLIVAFVFRLLNIREFITLVKSE